MNAGETARAPSSSQAIAFTAFAAVLVLAPSLWFGHVYDDHRFLVENDALQEFDVLWRAFIDPSVQTADDSYAGLWRPVRTLSFALDRWLFGGAAWASHLHNLMLHALQSGLVVAWLRSLGFRSWPLLLGGLCFALHPIQVESVAWISSRGDLLATTGVLAAVLLQARGRIGLACVIGTVALLSKEQAVVWPALLGITLLAQGMAWREVARALIWPAVLTLAFVGTRQLLLVEPLQEGGLGTSTGLASLLAMLGHQLWTLVLPAGGAFDWQMPSGVGLPVLLVGVVSVGALFHRTLRLPALWFHCALLPTLHVQSVIPLNIRVADRFLLMALPALAWGIAAALRRLSVVPRADRRVAVPAAVALIGLAGLTAQRAPAWRDDGTLWRDVAAYHARAGTGEDHWRAHAHLGVEAYAAGDLRHAREHFRRAAGSRAGQGDGQTRFRHAVVLEALAVQEGLGSATATSLLREAEFEYAAAVEGFARRRSEGVGDEPLARLAHAHLAFVNSGGAEPPDAVRRWMERPRPALSTDRRTPWSLRVEQFAKALAAAGDPSLARDLREWGSR